MIQTFLEKLTIVTNNDQVTATATHKLVYLSICNVVLLLYIYTVRLDKGR